MTELVPDSHEATEEELAERQAEEKPVKKTSARKAATIIEDIKGDVEKLAEDVEVKVEDVKAEVEKFVAELEGKIASELKVLHDQAILAEDQAKKDLYVLRLRAANMATTVDKKAEEEITAAKQKVAEAVEWLFAIEKRLHGVPRDIWDARYGRANV